jgi:hypothetical protein
MGKNVKIALKKYDMTVWIGFIWLKLGYKVKPLEHRTSGSINGGEIS